jgi:hypothetical protein
MSEKSTDDVIRGNLKCELDCLSHELMYETGMLQFAELWSYGNIKHGK